MISRLSISGAIISSCLPRGESCGPLAHGAALDSFFVAGSLKNCVYENSGSVDAIGIQLSQLDDFFYFGDDVVRRCGHHGVVIPRGFSIDEISPAITLPGFDERHVAAQRRNQHMRPAGEIANLFSFSGQRAVTGWRVKCRNSGAARANAL